METFKLYLCHSSHSVGVNIENMNFGYCNVQDPWNLYVVGIVIQCYYCVDDFNIKIVCAYGAKQYEISINATVSSWVLIKRN